ncbi:UNVERIFIED_CONTAM: ATP-dependent DNA helicase PIF6 [Sesamum angustifolium]|uniref:ATP-dependent DNA helicase n=1 Tax=Sesamum angustifolium TaxID=2727405 RepID=A0AAW2N7I9_9LAMI
MANRKAFETVDRTLRDMLGVDLPFGGKVMILGGDFRQVLPVVINGTKSQIIKASIVESSLWSSVKVLNLSENMRAQHDPHFSDFLLRVDYMKNRAIITPLNDDTNKLNEKAINAFPGEEVTYYSFDYVPDDTRNLYLPEFLNSISPGNLPPHKLVLKKGSPIMLLRNIDPKIGLCNGTRLICRGFGRNLIEVEILAGQFKRMRVFLPRIPLKSAEDAKMPFEMIRRQFPIRLSFALTINKSQGQTIPNVGIYLPNHVFSHGQLYVALSRGVSERTTKVLAKKGTNHDHSGIYTKNVVFKEIFTN